jgi:hypothetical protein
MDQDCNTLPKWIGGLRIQYPYSEDGNTLYYTHADQSNSETLESIYEPLDRQPEVRKFRLIALLPDLAWNNVECLLDQANLVSFADPSYVSYEALSYRWGDPQD